MLLNEDVLEETLQESIQVLLGILDHFGLLVFEEVLLDQILEL